MLSLLCLLCLAASVVAPPPVHLYPTSVNQRRSNDLELKCGDMFQWSVHDQEWQNGNADYVAVRCPRVRELFGSNPKSVPPHTHMDERTVGLFRESGVMSASCVQIPYCRQYNNLYAFWDREPQFLFCTTDRETAGLIYERMQEAFQIPEIGWKFQPKGRRCKAQDHYFRNSTCKPNNINSRGGMIVVRTFVRESTLTLGNYVANFDYFTYCPDGAVNTIVSCNFDSVSKTFQLKQELLQPCVHKMGVVKEVPESERASLYYSMPEESDMYEIRKALMFVQE